MAESVVYLASLEYTITPYTVRCLLQLSVHKGQTTF